MEEQQTFFIQGTAAEICRDVVADVGEFDRSIAELTRTGAATVEKCQEVVKLVSRRLLKKLNLTEYNRIKQQESRAGIVSRSGQEDAFYDLKSLRVLDSPIGEVLDAPPKPEKKILLPQDFKPSEEMLLWAKTECPNVNADFETPEFITFWREIATKNNKRTVRGWNATWKGRFRELQRKSINGNGYGRIQTAPVIGRNDEQIPEPQCKACNDSGEISQQKAGTEWQFEFVPCPDCKRAAA